MIAAVANGWNDTHATFPAVCAHELFEQQAARAPAAIALACGARQVTYGELNERANRVAHHLRRRGVGPDVLVGVCLERSPELVIALFAVWKAGGAYVPLDPAYPPERLAFMIGDAGLRHLLTEEKCRDRLPASGAEALCLDSGWALLASERPDDPAPVSSPSNLAYVMYTSGSTGTPKGALILHAGLVNYLWWAIAAYAVGPGRSVPVHTSVSFDLTVTSLFTPLLAGGTVELLAQEAGAQSLIAALRRRGDRSLVKITPAHLELLGQELSAEQAAGMTRTFVIGGENLTAESLRLWREHAPSTRLLNEYGPTETVVGCAIYEVQPEDPCHGSVPIGRPIANTQLYVLDERHEPVPAGVMGELYIGGVGVARGYLNRPELTAERFLPDPFSGVPGARLFKSGDLARRRDDGTLEYLGRSDQQVKIRGYRIELGEVEAALAAQPEVASCVLLAREDKAGMRQLVAYVVARAFAAPTAPGLRAFLAQTLPDYMVPAQFVFLPAMPLTSNGKIDRRALPAPAPLTGTGGPPRTRTQLAIAALWEELLLVQGLGLRDDFFELGGSSLTAAGLVSRLRTEFDVEVGLATLFDRPDVAGLSEVVDLLVLSNRGAGGGPREEFDL